MTELLNVQGLSAGYGEAVVLHNVSLSLKAGETLALLGRNGTGKTTLINTLAGATRQHAGSISLGSGTSALALHRLPSHERAAAGMGWVPQERNIFNVAHSARKPHGRGATRQKRPLGQPLDTAARVRVVPPPGRTQDHPGYATLGR